jgi:RNA polymerase sigma-70 factor (ECF subfamily)
VKRPPSSNEALVARLKPFRRPLLAHCYRMLGSVGDADDAVQETYLRVWGGEADLKAAASFRAWLYGTATTVCLTDFDRDGGRELPSGVGPPTADPHAEAKAAGPGVRWIEPIPDALVNVPARDPEAASTAPDSLRLALAAGLQRLAPRQRAVFLLRDVLAFSADEVAGMLEMTPGAVKSAFQRARAQLEKDAPTPTRGVAATRAAARALLDAFIAAFETSDATAISALLTDDVTFEVTPALTWFAGKSTCAPYIMSHVLGSPGEWQMVPSAANGQPAAVAYRRGDDGEYQAFGVVVLTPRAEGISRIALFTGTEVVRRFEVATTESEPAPVL